MFADIIKLRLPVFLFAFLLLQLGCGNGKKRHPERLPSLSDTLPQLVNKAKNVKTICYSPTNYNPLTSQFPTANSMRQDLQLLYNIGFRGVITYGSDGTLAQIPPIAKSIGFELVVMGVYDPNSSAQLNAAIAQRAYVDGYCVGNEKLNVLYNINTLNLAISEVRSSTGKPVTTTEVYNTYTPELIAAGDWAFPNAHPYWAGVKDPAAAALWVSNQYAAFNGNGKFVWFKEEGMPTAGDAAMNETVQDQFFQTLTANYPNVYWAWFEAFDQPWKTSQAVEPYWGIYKSDRTPKLAAH